MAEAAVCHVELHLPEDRLGFYAPLPPVPSALFGDEPLLGLLPVPPEPMVDLDNVSVAIRFAAAAQRASAAVLRPIPRQLRDVSAFRTALSRADALHVLSHGADEVVLLLVVVHSLGGEGIRLVARASLYVEVVVLDKGPGAGLFHEAVVLLRAVARVGHQRLWHTAVAVLEGGHEGHEREGITGIGEKVEVGNELAVGGYLQVVSGLGLPVVHGILLHTHEGGTGISLGHGVAPLHLFQGIAVALDPVAALFQLSHLLLPFPYLLLLLTVTGCGLMLQALIELADDVVQQLGRDLLVLLLGHFVLDDGVLDLKQYLTYLLLGLALVTLHPLAPDEGVLVGLGLYFRAVYILHVQTQQTVLVELQHDLGEDVADLILGTVAETVDGDEVGLLITRQPDKVEVTLQCILDATAGVDVVHVGKQEDLEHRAGIVSTAA